MGRVDRAVAVVLTADGPEHVPLGPPPATADLAVGDWVALDPGGRLAGVLPRRSALTRAAAGRATEPQVVAANLDTVFVVAVAAAANPRRMERAMALAWASGALPVVVLTKTDRATELEAAVDSVRQVAIGVDVLVTSAREGTGLEELKARLGRGRTAALLGPSGVGKSSLVNALAGEDVLEVAAERNDGKGRHTTTFRQLVVLPGAGVLVDTPGVRELGLWESAESVDAVFVDLADLASGCRFSDCAHDREPGCAIRVGLADGTVSPERLASGRKLQREVRYREARLDARVAREERRRWKAQTRSSRAPRRPGRR